MVYITSQKPVADVALSQNKLPQLVLEYIYILKYLQSNFIGSILFFWNS